MATQTVEGAAIRLGSASDGAPAAVIDSTPPGLASAVRGVVIGFALIAAAALIALLFTAATFGYSVGELL